MINLLIGAPGGGKSYEAVVYHVLAALRRGRKVITNLPLNIDKLEAIEPGCTSLIEVREKTLAVEPVIETKGVIPVGLLARSVIPTFSNRAFANVEDYMSTWRHPVDGFGPLYVVDECHFCLPRARTSVAVEEWFSMHRHYNCDVLLITQSAGKISVAIKDLIQVCYKVRKAVALGRPTGYIRKVLDGVNGGEVSCTERKYEKKYFGLYRSHTQGLAIEEKNADDVAPLSVKFRRFSYIFYLVTAVVIAWAFWPSDKPKPLPMLQKATSANHALPSSSLSPASSSRPASAPVPSPASSAPSGDPDPFKAQGVHLSGWAKMGDRIIHTFVISAGGFRLFELTEPEIKKAGYAFRPLGECSGLLTHGQTVRTVICDAPTGASGKNDAPVLVAVNGDGKKIASSRD